jgi:hypothetical protein
VSNFVVDGFFRNVSMFLRSSVFSVFIRAIIVFLWGMS